MAWSIFGGESGTLWPVVYSGRVGDTMVWSICGVSRGHHGLEYLRGESGHHGLEYLQGESGTPWSGVSAG